ncbi:MAG: bifunctional precorrin-2 dehydrogenase/sirohydrochlorin ferrochelatase [Deltaproteobacteria bacterium]|nr:bifunctional precorrin-2 dehydrogenase/sirohydrochlorin ferrochelatase [Deltaproteobacteria bacterium]
MSYYPILIDLTGKEVLVVGGGEVAQRKVDSLLETGAIVKVVAGNLGPRLRKRLERGEIVFLGREFQEQHLDGSFMVFVATSDRNWNSRVSHLAKERGILVNAVDQPSDCSFILPSVVRRGDLLICISTSGKSPALAKKIREELETRFGEEYGLFLALMGRLRKLILNRGLDHRENRKVFYKLVDSDLLGFLKDAEWEKAASLIRETTGVEWTAENIEEIIGTGQGVEAENETI